MRCVVLQRGDLSRCLRSDALRVGVLGIFAGVLALLAGCTSAGDVAAAGSYQPGREERADERKSCPPPCIPVPTCNSLTQTNRQCRPLGEVYAGASFLANPAPGFCVEVGQVFARPAYGTWAFELEAGWQDLAQ